MPLTWLEIDSKAIEFNIQQFRKAIGAGKLLMPVIKANAYGHGFFEVAKICFANKNVDKICVVNLQEALSLVKNGFTQKQIIILSFFELEENLLIQAIKYKIAFPIYNIESAIVLDKAAKKMGDSAIVHIKIDTGASRVGILPAELDRMVEQIQNLKNIRVEGVFSHFASSETDSEFTKKQITTFKNCIKKIEDKIGEVKIKHIACSAATILHKDARFNAVRLGLSMYGLYPSNSTKKKIKLKSVLKWVTKIMQTKIVQAGTKIGYGGSFVTKRKTTVSILPVGYWDGYDRGLSNNSQVLIRGKKCPVVGRICMNMMIIDTTGVKTRLGDQAVLIGTQGKQQITADELADRIKTINYEIVDRINPLLPRIVK